MTNANKPHPHHLLMALYAQDAAETERPWKRWEFKQAAGKWTPQFTHPVWDPLVEYRPKVKTIKVNGFDVPAPCKDTFALGLAKTYYVVELHRANFNPACIPWHGDESDLRYMERGLIHLSAEAAIAHAKAMVGIDPGEVK